MTLDTRESAPETVLLHHAVLCVDCELVTSSVDDHCPVCKGHALLPLAGIVGGRLVDYRASHLQRQQTFLFDLNVTVKIPQMEASDLSATIESISRVIGPKLSRSRASLHINVEPVNANAPMLLKAA